jgi:ADP-ribose pyrophosphatase YjhB (NUDIX family)
MPQNDPEWLRIARELQALAQTGLTFAKDHFDRGRYDRVSAIAAEMIAQGSGFPAEQLKGVFDAQSGYATPKVDVRGAVFRDDGRVLMVREIMDDGRWTLPGGWADVNQTPREAVEREIREESGYTARAVKLAACYDRTTQGHTPPHAFYVYKLFFICELTGGEATPSDETSEIDWLDPHGTYELSDARVTAKQIARMAEHWREPRLPTDFD